VTVAQPPSPFGRVDLTDDDVVTGFHEVARVPYWVNCGIYALSEEALARFPEKGDHETTAFPELAAEGKLRAFRHTGVWLTVNTPKELRRADEYVGEHPEWLA
jgi:NDP-sugar pyrophosphorylase family protein